MGILLLYSSERKSLPAIAICLLAASLACEGTPATAANRMSNEQIGKLGRYVMLANLEANQTLLGNVRIVANALDTYVNEHGHLPVGSDEVDPFLKQMEETLPNNVFAVDSGTSDSLAPPGIWAMVKLSL